MKRVLIVDDHPIYRYGLSQLLAKSSRFEPCGEASNPPAALQVMRQSNPDIAVLDVAMPGTNGIELLKLMLAEKPHLLVLMLSLHDESLYALRALRAGAKGYLMKDEAVDSVLEALEKVAAGGIFLSPRLSERLIFKLVHGSTSEIGAPVDKLSDRELEVLELIGRGGITRGIANQLNLSIKTIETHRAHLKRKLGFKRQDELVRFATEWIAAGSN
jgi:DNA-binding NarL/FixJ family response regulator